MTGQEGQLITLLVSLEMPEEPKAPANTKAGNRREMCEFLNNRGVKRALIDGEQYYFEENIKEDGIQKKRLENG